MFKPAHDAEEACWIADVLDGVVADGCRVARPVRSRSGAWVVEGWAAYAFVEGEAGPAGRYPELLRAALAFSAAVRSVPRPAFLDRRQSRWALADRVAWQEESVRPIASAQALLARLERLREPLDLPAQLVHGDLSGNVLFAAGQEPAIIDFSPYWRPAGYAEAIAVIDGWLWHDEPPDLVRLLPSTVATAQLLVRAAIFRLITDVERAREVGRELADSDGRHDHVAALLEGLAR